MTEKTMCLVAHNNVLCAYKKLVDTGPHVLYYHLHQILFVKVIQEVVK